MLPILLSVIVISFSGVMMPGLMFGVTLAKAVRSPLAGVFMSLGHAVVEVPLILLMYFGFARFFQNSLVQLALTIVGGGMIIWLGITMFRARAELVTGAKDLPGNAFTAGILTSLFNPFFLLWWATIGSMLIMKFLGFGITGLILFIVVHWSCDLLWLSFISITVYKTHSLWGRKFQVWLFSACSLLLIGFGTWYIISGIQLIV